MSEVDYLKAPLDTSFAAEALLQMYDLRNGKLSQDDYDLWLARAELSSLKEVTLRKTDYEQHYAPDHPTQVVILAQLEGSSLVRVGNWKSRKNPVAVEQGEVLALFGREKRAIEARDQKLSCFLLAEALPSLIYGPQWLNFEPVE